MLCSFQMDGNTLNVEKLESRVKELTPDDFTGDVHEIIEQCVNQGTSRSDQNYVLNLYVHNAYILHILRLLFRLAEDDDECMVARKYSDCVIEQIDFLRSKILQELNEN